MALNGRVSKNIFIVENRLGHKECCWLCDKPSDNPSVSFEDHHIIPRHLGGENGPLVLLCADCHTNVHSCATSLIKKGEPLFIYELQLQQERCVELASIIFKVYKSLEATGRLHEFKKTKLQITLNPRINKKLKQLAKSLGFSQDKAVQYAIELAHSMRITTNKDS